MDFSAYGYSTSQWLKFVAANPSAARDGFSGNDPEGAFELQAITNETRAKAGAALLAKSNSLSKVDISTTIVPSQRGHNIPIRQYSPKIDPSNQSAGHPAVVYFHGGGYLFGTESTEDLLCTRIAAEVGVTVLNVNYSHTPQNKFPVAHEDVLEAYGYIEEHLTVLGISSNTGIAVFGISAGASLAAEFVQHDLRLFKENPFRKRIVKGAVLSIPWLIHVDNNPLCMFKSADIASSVQCRDAPVIPWPRLKLFSDLLAAEDVADPRLNVPLRLDEELKEWPRTGLVIAGMDPLRDDGLMFAKRLDKLG